jgi:hypothetical protein
MKYQICIVIFWFGMVGSEWAAGQSDSVDSNATARPSVKAPPSTTLSAKVSDGLVVGPVDDLAQVRDIDLYKWGQFYDNVVVIDKAQPQNLQLFSYNAAGAPVLKMKTAISAGADGPKCEDNKVNGKLLSQRMVWRHTPAGYFNVMNLDIDAHSNIYNLAPMHYAVFFSPAIATHERPAKADEALLGQGASHACVRMNSSDAKTLFFTVLLSGGAIDTGGTQLHARCFMKSEDKIAADAEAKEKQCRQLAKKREDTYQKDMDQWLGFGRGQNPPRPYFSDPDRPTRAFGSSGKIALDPDSEMPLVPAVNPKNGNILADKSGHILYKKGYRTLYIVKSDPNPKPKCYDPASMPKCLTAEDVANGKKPEKPRPAKEVPCDQALPD